MSDGRNKLNDFSLLKSLVGGKSIKNKTDRLRKVHAEKLNMNHDNNKLEVYDTNSKQGIFPQIRKERNNQHHHSAAHHLLRMPQYGQRRHEEFSVDIPEIQEDELVIEIDLQREAYKEEQRLFKWLCTRFPKCFNPKNKRPLKIGISEDIQFIYHNEHFSPINQYLLRKVIKRYVGDSRYQRSVLEYKKRFNLCGESVEEFSGEHISYAKRRLEEIAEKAYLRSKGIDIKMYYQQKQRENTEITEKPSMVDDHT